MKSTKLNVLSAGVMALSGILVLSGCHSTHHNYSYYPAPEPAATGGTGNTTAETTGAGASKGGTTMAAGQENVVVPLYQEHVKIGKHEVDAGGVRIRKHVTSEALNQPLELRQETLSIERLPADQGAPATSGQGTAAAAPQQGQLGQPFQEGEMTIHLQKEEPLVERSMSQSGKIVAQKHSTTQQTTVKENVRKEQVDIEKLGNPSGVTLSQNLKNNDAVGGTPATGGKESGSGSSGQITDLNQFAQTSDKAALEGRDVQLSNARVQQIVSDTYLTVGDGGAQAVVHTREPLMNIHPGDPINVKGQVRQFTSASSLSGQDQALKGQKVYIEATRVDKAQ